MLGLDASRIGAQDFSEWSKQRKEKFREYVTEREKKFQRFLKERWRKMKVFAGEREDTVPKPDHFPTAPEADSIPSRKLRSKTVLGSSSDIEEPSSSRSYEPSAPSGSRTERPDETELSASENDGFSVNFYGNTFSIPQAASLRNLQLKEVSPEGITTFWSELAEAPTEPLVEKLRAIKGDRNLDGWAYLQLVRTVSRKLYEDEATARATTWGLLLKSGYKTRLGYNEDRVFLLVQANSTLYEVPYFNLGGTRYFLYAPEGNSPDVQSLRTYRKGYPGELNPVKITLEIVPQLVEEPQRRTLEFTFDNRKYEFDVTVNRNAVDYFGTIPQLSLDKYFKAVNRTNPVTDLTGQLEEVLKDIDRDKRLEFILRFVQTAFGYKTDDEQFGRENYLLPAETLYYPHSDCEDRALLFATLVRNLLNRRVVGLDYPGHVATAVQGDEFLSGSYLEIKRSRFFIADPTYTNADPGMVMPRYKNKNPQVILTEDF